MQMRLLREANEVGEEDLGEFHKKIYGCSPLQGPLGEGPVRLGTSAPLRELEANQLDLSWDGRGVLPLGISFQQFRVGSELKGIRMWPTAPGPHLLPIIHYFRGSPTLNSPETSHVRGGMELRILVPSWRLGVGGGHWAERVS